MPSRVAPNKGLTLKLNTIGSLDRYLGPFVNRFVLDEIELIVAPQMCAIRPADFHGHGEENREADWLEFYG